MNPRFITLISIVAAAALYRVLPHPVNFTPVGAIALFAGAKFADKYLALAVTLCAMFVADLFLGFYNSMAFVYAGIAAMVAIGFWLRNNNSLSKTIIATLAGSAAFYLLSNLGVWMMTDMYPHTAAGLVTNYLAAIPFLQNSLISNLLFVGLFFGAFHLLENKFSQLRLQNSQQNNLQAQ